MALSESLAARIRDALARKKGVEEKKMFGGVGFLLNGNLLVGVRKDSLLVRLGPEQGDEALLEAHVSEFKIGGRGAVKGWGRGGLAGGQGGAQLKGGGQGAGKVVGERPGQVGRRNE